MEKNTPPQPSVPVRASIVSNVELLRRVPMFSELKTEDLTQLTMGIQKRRFKRGDTIIQQGEASGQLFMLLTGKARVLSCDGRGREVIIATVEVGDCVGEMGLIDGEPASATVRAEGACDALVLSRAAFTRCLQDNCNLAEAVMRSLVRRLRKADRQIESLALLDVYSRVYESLRDMAVEDANGHRVIKGRISRQELAKMVGASREMVSRVMKNFEQEGVVVLVSAGVHHLAERPRAL